ncbi:POU domain, class 6, transcription factor 2 isoform X2 [Culicoides brevitarsis]|uniref:POU domain, class 6, transcription factor 2 isoform X2 n=1 Tax=Culicoides brevitarsis TaxID=469753 RepID=UPI00307C9122
MAEGFEESETNNNSNNCEGAVMIGTVMPSLASSLNFGSIKKELESACVTSKIHLSPAHSDNDDRNRSPEPQKRSVKEEHNDDDDRSNASTPQSQRNSPEPKEHHIFNEHYQNSDKSSLSSSKNNSNSSQMSSLNGTMQDLINLQKLQNLSIFQHPQLGQQLPGLSNLTSGQQNLLNSPLNLSLGGHSNMPAAESPQLPQLILASGQLIQGIQGAQLLIPTSQGVTTQTILTIPVSQQIASSVTKEQIFQNITQLISRADSLSSPLPPHLPLSQSQIINSSNLLNSHFLSNNAQQLLSSIQPPNILPTLAAAAAAQQQAAAAQSQHEHQQSQQSNKSSLVSKSSQHLSSARHSPLAAGNAGNQSKLNHHHHHRDQNRPKSHSPQPTNLSNNLSSMFDVKSSGGAARLTPIAERSSDERDEHHRKSSPMHQNSSRDDSHSPNFSNRLPTTNGELIITKSHPHHMSSGNNAGPSRSSQSSPQSGHHNISNYHLPSSMTKSPTNSSSHKPPLSPAGSDNSGGDLLSDSPNELTINQTNCNVVDGIDLDEIKEFAKAFKLRRLSLGLTQTQVGQALSVTEGPAYSQSAICRFEKLDITPKSAQKIKPVLEKWMKEAEERYKTGQNHLTDFIGVEPSKKRKRRTSFTPQALELLNAHFERNTHPSGTEITGLAHQLGYEREVIRIWFCNKRQALKNTVRMMSKGMV